MSNIYFSAFSAAPHFQAEIHKSENVSAVPESNTILRQKPVANTPNALFTK